MHHKSSGQPATLTVDAALELIGRGNISKKSLYQVLQRGEIASMRVGHRILVLRDPLERLLLLRRRRAAWEREHAEVA